MPLDAPRIVDGLRFLRKADRKLTVFGANSHKYKLRPCLDESKIVEFERHYSLSLPEDYRNFLMHVGNGGAGPYCGIHRLDQLHVTYAGFFKPFPFRHQW